MSIILYSVFLRVQFESVLNTSSLVKMNGSTISSDPSVLENPNVFPCSTNPNVAKMATTFSECRICSQKMLSALCETFFQERALKYVQTVSGNQEVNEWVNNQNSLPNKKVSQEILQISKARGFWRHVLKVHESARELRDIDSNHPMFRTFPYLGQELSDKQIPTERFPMITKLDAQIAQAKRRSPSLSEVRYHVIHAFYGQDPAKKALVAKTGTIFNKKSPTMAKVSRNFCQDLKLHPGFEPQAVGYCVRAVLAYVREKEPQETRFVSVDSKGYASWERYVKSKLPDAMSKHIATFFSNVSSLVGTPLDRAVTVAHLSSIVDRHVITTTASLELKAANEIQDFTEDMDKGDDVEIMIDLAPLYPVPMTVFRFQKGTWDDYMTHAALNNIMTRYSGEGLLGSTKLTSLLRSQNLAGKSILDVCVVQLQSTMKQENWKDWTAKDMRNWSEWLYMQFPIKWDFDVSLEQRNNEYRAIYGKIPTDVTKESSAEFVQLLDDSAQRICTWYLSKSTPTRYLSLKFLETIGLMSRYVKVDTSDLYRGEVVNRSQLDPAFGAFLNDFWNTNVKVAPAAMSQDVKFYIENKGVLSFSRAKHIATKFAFGSEDAQQEDEVVSTLKTESQIPVMYHISQSDDRKIPAFEMKNSDYESEEETIIFPTCLKVVRVEKQLVKNIWKQHLGAGEKVPALVVSLGQEPGACEGQPVVHW